MMQKEGIIGIGEDNVFPEKGVFEKSMVSIDFFEDIIIPVHKPKLIIAFGAGFVVKIKRIFSHKYIIVA